VKILFDHCTPRPLRQVLTGHNVTTANQHEWSNRSNGDLLDAAERIGAEIFVTTDQEMETKQEFQDRRFGTIVITDTNLRRIKHHIPALLAAVRAAQPGTIQHVKVAYGAKDQPVNEITFDEQRDHVDLNWTDPETGDAKNLTSVRDIDAGLSWLAAHRLIRHEEIPERRREVLEDLKRERERKHHR
jgi:hypothetical protein